MESPVLNKLYATSSKEFAIALLSFTTLMSCGGIVWGVLCVVFDVMPAAAIPFGYTVLSILNLLLWYFAKSFRFSRAFQVFISLTLPFLLQAILGGYQKTGVVMLWAIFGLVSHPTFHRLKQTIPWVIYFLILLEVSIYFDEYEFRDCVNGVGTLLIRDPSGGWWNLQNDFMCQPPLLSFNGTSYGELTIDLSEYQNQIETIMGLQ